ASSAVAQAGYAVAIPSADALWATRVPTTPTPSTPTATNAIPTSGAAGPVRRASRPAAPRVCSDRATAAAMAIHGGIITATQIAVLRTDISASPPPTA